jgi:hypothetical protein
MNSQNAFGSKPNSVANAARETENTLRTIAALPAPRGLEERVIAGLRSTPRSGRVLRWPGLLNPTESWLRTAAAAAIVSVVVGGGWGVYKRVQPAAALAIPPHVAPAAGFSNAGAVRVPQSLPTPVVEQPVPVQPSQTAPAAKIRDKATPSVRHDRKGTKPAAANKVTARPSVTVAR